MAKEVESSILEAGRPESEAVEYTYKNVEWKDFIRKPKYIRIETSIREDPRATSGFLIPISILIVISFPPLFGHELIALLCGVVYGLWIGFAIVAAGTFLGEIGTWFAFKYAFRRKAVKLEKTNLNYGALARVTRDGGFLMVVIIRFSVIPSHFSTAVFSTCDVKFWHFAVATFLTLPKQIILVYLGVLLDRGSKNHRVNTIVLCVTFLITVVAAAYIYSKMRKTMKILLEEQAARLNAAKQISSEDLSSNDSTEVTEIRWQTESVGKNYTKPPLPSWQEGNYEMDDIRRPGARAQEFI